MDFITSIYSSLTTTLFFSYVIGSLFIITPLPLHKVYEWLRIRPRISIKREIYLKGFSGFCLLFILLASSSIQFSTFLSSDKMFQRKINFETKTIVKNQAPKLILLISPYPIFSTI